MLLPHDSMGPTEECVSDVVTPTIVTCGRCHAHGPAVALNLDSFQIDHPGAVLQTALK